MDACYTEGGSLIEPPAQRHSETSVEAAEAIEPNAGTLRAAVLEYLRSCERATDEQIQIALGMNPSTERPRRIELVDAGLVIDSGFKGTTASGRNAVMWRVK